MARSPWPETVATTPAPLAVDDLVAGGEAEVEGAALAAGQPLGRGRGGRTTPTAGPAGR